MRKSRKAGTIKAVSYQDVERAEIKEKGAKNVDVRILVGPADGAKNFIMRRFSIKKGGHTPSHAHSWEHEVYVLSGKGVVKGKKKKYPVCRGSVLFIPGGEKHQFINTGKTNLEFICVIPIFLDKRNVL